MKDDDSKNAGSKEADSQQVEAFEPMPGELLSAARDKKGWSIGRVAQALNLDEGTIEALEANRFDDLGAPVFARGHLRKYARLVDLDTTTVLEAYVGLEGIEKTPPVVATQALATTDGSRRKGYARTVLIVLVILAAAVLVWRILATLDQSPSPVGGRTELPIDQTVPVEGAEDPPVAREESSEEPSQEAAQPVSIPIPVEVDQQEAFSEADEPVAPPVEAAVEIADETQIRVEISFLADSWIEVRDSDGERLLYELGRQGRRRVATGVPPLRLFLGNADGTEILIDGQAFPIPDESRLGRTARFTIPVDSP